MFTLQLLVHIDVFFTSIVSDVNQKASVAVLKDPGNTVRLPLVDEFMIMSLPEQVT